MKFSSKTLDKLMKYNWPGNVRELRHTIEKAVILCDSDVLMPDDFIIAHSYTADKLKSEKPLTFAEIEKTGSANCSEEQ